MSQRSSCQFEDQTGEMLVFVVRGNLKAVRAVLKKHPGCANMIYEKHTLLDYPCRHGNSQMVEALIEGGVDVNNCNAAGCPPLYVAIFYNQLQIAKLLIQRKARFEAVILHDKLTMLDLAILYGKYEIAQLLYGLVRDKTVKQVEQFQLLAKKYSIRYYNYQLFIEGLASGKTRQQVGDYFERPKLDSEDPEQQTCCCFAWFAIESLKEPKQQPAVQNPEVVPESERKTLGTNEKQN